MSPARVRLCAGGRVDASAQKHNALPSGEERRCGAVCLLLPIRATHPHLCQGNVCTSGHTKVFFLLIENLSKDSVVVMATAQRRVLHILQVKIHTSS